MHRCILFLSLLFVAMEAQAQKNYIKYHQQIIRAEELFFVRKYDSSFIKYKELFTNYSPFAKDCFTALQFAAMRKDTADANFFFLKAFENGVTWNVLYKSKRIKELLEDKKYTKEIQKIYTQGRANYIASINKKIRDSINHLLENDFAIEIAIDKKTNQNQIYRDSNSIYHVFPSDVIGFGVFDKNLRLLMQITKDYGYPGDHMIGIWDAELDKKSIGNYLFESIASLILYHQFYGVNFLKDDLLKAVKNGELLPTEFAVLYDYAYEEYSHTLGELGGYNLVYHFNFKCDFPPKDKFYNIGTSPYHYSKDSVLVNQCRYEIGMPSLQHQQLKKDFARRNDLLLGFGYQNLL